MQRVLTFVQTKKVCIKNRGVSVRQRWLKRNIWTLQRVKSNGWLRRYVQMLLTICLRAQRRHKIF